MLRLVVLAATLSIACTSGPPPPDEKAQVKGIAEHRAEVERFLRENKESPIPPERRSVLLPLRYFDPDPSYSVPAQLKVSDERPVFPLTTSTGTVERYARATHEIAQMRARRLEALPHQRASLDAARKALDALRPEASRDLDAAMDVCLHIIGDHAAKVDGIKISLLDHNREIAMRRRLPAGVKMYTGDDFNYPGLILGDGQGYSHALLGIFDPIAPAASTALAALDAGDRHRYEAILAPTVPLSRHIFQAPTYFYKTGVVFLAYLNGHQPHFRMVGGQESARSVVHLSELFVLADRAGLLREPEVAAARMRRVLALAGVDS